MKIGALCLVFVSLALAPLSSNAWEAQGRVTRLEPTFADHLNIRLDVAAGACPAGSWLSFHGHGSTAQEQKESIKAVYAGLLASLYAGKHVVLYGTDQGCVVQQVHLLDT